MPFEIDFAEAVKQGLNTSDLRADLRKLNNTMQLLCDLQRFSLLGPDHVYRFIYRDQEFDFYLPYAAVDRVQKAILSSGGFFELPNLAIIKNYVNPGAVVLDAGANIGNHTVFFSKVCGASEVHSFEPQRTVLPILARNVELNNLQNVTIHPCALGDQHTNANLIDHKGANLGASTFTQGADGAYPVETIDALGLERLDFIKIDVEGAQMAVLRGGIETLKRFRPLIACELWASRGEIAEPTAFMADLGYGVEQLDKNNVIFRPL